MAINRSSLKTGPAIVTHDGAVNYFSGGLKLTEETETFEINVDTIGKADERVKDRKVTISGKPSGTWDNLAALFPWVTVAIGTRIHGDTDKALVIHCLDGTRYTYHNAALTKMPSLKFAATETLIGDVEWTARVKNNTEPTAANSIFTRDSSPFTDKSLIIANIKTQSYMLTWGSDGWSSFRTVDGVEVSFDLKTQDLSVDGYGVLDQVIEGLGVTAKFKPIGPTQAEIDAKLALQGVAGAAQGSSLNARGEDLIISGASVYVIIRAAAAKSSGQEFDMSKLRNGELLAVATRSFDMANAALPLAYVGTSAPLPPEV